MHDKRHLNVHRLAGNYRVEEESAAQALSNISIWEIQWTPKPPAQCMISHIKNYIAPSLKVLNVKSGPERRESWRMCLFWPWSLSSVRVLPITSSSLILREERRIEMWLLHALKTTSYEKMSVKFNHRQIISGQMYSL